jgi:hypothetical protein
MNLKKYISGKLLLRGMMVLAIVFLAALFDALHAGSEELVNETRQRSETQFQHNGHVFLYNQVSVFKIRKGVDKLFAGLLFAVTGNDFLSKYHNCRTFYMLKAESRQNLPPVFRNIHFMEFNPCHHAGPDDEPFALLS